MKAVIACGGFGTRFLPITKSVPKEMLPLGNKPVIEHIIKELVECGIKDILIISSKHKQIIKEYFSKNDCFEKFLNKTGNSKALQNVNYQQKLANIQFIEQEKPLGFQDAISYAKSFVGEENFVLCTGDNLFYSKKENCTKKLMQVFEKYKQSVIVTHKEKRNKLYQYGVVKYNKKTNNVEYIVEKPTKNYPSNKIVAGRYLLTNKIFNCMEKNHKYVGKELNFVESLNLLAKSEGCLVVEFQGKMFDVGTLEGFKKTFKFYTKKHMNN